MNPAEDMILFGDELAEGMWVLTEDATMRQPHGSSEEEMIRAQRFRRVTRLRRSGGTLIFIGEWVDGYQEVHKYAEDWGWIVKREPPAEEEPG
jgi:hypothetical protein